MVFPGASVPVTPEQVDAALRTGEERLEARTSHGERVAVVVKPGTSGRFILFLYGNAMTIADTPQIRAVLSQGGASVICFDYLGYGLSEGEPSEAGCYRSAHAAMNLIEDKLGAARGSVDVVGWSVGSAVSLHLASHRAIRRLVLLSPFAGIAPYLLAPFGLHRTRLKRLGPFAGASRAGDVQSPALLITGEADVQTPPWMADDLAADMHGPTEVVKIPGVGHNDLFSEPSVWRRVLAFLASADEQAGVS
jgi:pimeloyl-ACP methyl ester carboxylesterase